MAWPYCTASACMLALLLAWIFWEIRILRASLVKRGVWRHGSQVNHRVALMLEAFEASFQYNLNLNHKRSGTLLAEYSKMYVIVQSNQLSTSKKIGPVNGPVKVKFGEDPCDQRHQGWSKCTENRRHQSINQSWFLEWPKWSSLLLGPLKMLNTEECPEMNVWTGKFSDDVEMTVE